MRKALYITLLAVLASACSTDVMEPTKMGSISLSLSSDVEVGVATRADAQDYSDFLVDIKGTTHVGGDAVEQHFDNYGQMPESIELPYGYYRVSAQSCTETVAANGYGCARYYGESEEISLLSQELKPVAVKCKMANGKATMTFDDTFLKDFADISIDITVGQRTVRLTSDEANAPTDVFFNVDSQGSDLLYRITATVAQGTEQEREVHYNNVASPVKLHPGKWAKITFKSNHNGVIGPDIDVNEDMEQDSWTENIDPEEGEVVEDFPTIVISVNTQIEDATVIDCEFDVYK